MGLNIGGRGSEGYRRRRKRIEAIEEEVRITCTQCGVHNPWEVHREANAFVERCRACGYVQVLCFAVDIDTWVEEEG